MERTKFMPILTFVRKPCEVGGRVLAGGLLRMGFDDVVGLERPFDKVDTIVTVWFADEVGVGLRVNHEPDTPVDDNVPEGIGFNQEGELTLVNAVDVPVDNEV